MQHGGVCDIKIAYVRIDLRDCVATQLHVPDGNVRQAERNYVAHPHALVDDGVSVGQVCTIVHGRLSGLSDHSVYLVLDLCCSTGEEKTKSRNMISPSGCSSTSQSSHETAKEVLFAGYVFPVKTGSSQ